MPILALRAAILTPTEDTSELEDVARQFFDVDNLPDEMGLVSLTWTEGLWVATFEGTREALIEYLRAYNGDEDPPAELLNLIQE